MKKVFFLLLFFVVFGAANMSAQVRIGGDGEPHTAAVLDLNVDDTDTGNKGALALPRVNLDDNTAQLNGTEPIAGMLVYNTNEYMTGGNGVGVYFFDGSEWVIISGDGIVGNEVTGATVGGGLTWAGSGTSAEPYTLGIATNGVGTSHISDGSVSLVKTTITKHQLTTASVGTTQNSVGSVAWPTGCNASNAWFTAFGNGITVGTVTTAGITLLRAYSGTGNVVVHIWCFS